MYFTVDYFIEIINKIKGSNNITLRKVNVKPCGFDNMYMGKDLTEDKLYQTIDHFNESKIRPAKFYSMFLSKIDLFYDGIVESVRYCLLMVIK